MIEIRRHVRVLVDTGPLVAILRERDSRHDVCTETLNHIEPPLLTCWPVITEAAWLLRKNAQTVSQLLQICGSDLFQLLEISQDELTEVNKLFKRYRDLSPQLADLCLVHIAMREDIDTIFTLDRRDFSIYRYKGKSGFTLLPDDEYL